MIDKYPKFLPQWTSAMCHIYNDRERTFLLFKKHKYNIENAIGEADDHFNLDWYSGTCCLTGEAFFHQGAPSDCRECSGFTLSRSQVALRSLDNLYQYKIELAKHLQEVHPETWEKWNGALKQEVKLIEH